MIGDINDKIKNKVKNFFCIPEIDSDHIDCHIKNIEASLMSSPYSRIVGDRFNDDKVTEIKKAI